MIDMADMLVKLYELPELDPIIKRLQKRRFEIRRPMLAHKRWIVEWVHQNYPGIWEWETEVAMENRPVSCFMAVEKPEMTSPPEDPYAQPAELLVGFACYDVAALGMFGPMGVRADYQGYGIGKGLLVACLKAMCDQGYAYAQIGWVGPMEFYAKTVGATVIVGSAPGPFKPPLSIQ
jgi:GNAT superfamily N-acetyltransferase